MRNLIAVPLLRHLLVAAAGFVLVVAVLETTGPFRNAQMASFAYLAIAAGGLTVLTGLNGQLSLGHGALMAVGAYTTALLLQGDEPTLPLVGVLVAATLVALVVGVLVGIPAARLHGPYIAGATLALAIAVPGVALFFDSLGGEQGLSVRVPDAPDWVLDAIFFITGAEPTSTKYLAYIGWLCLIGTYVVLANLARSRVGRTWRAVRDDEVSAELPVSTSAAPGCWRSWSAPAAPVWPARCWRWSPGSPLRRPSPSTCRSPCSARSCWVAWAAWPGRCWAPRC